MGGSNEGRESGKDRFYRSHLIPPNHFYIWRNPFNFNSFRQIQTKNHENTPLYRSASGIPHYLREIEAGKSATQNIDEICFSKNGLLNTEFSRLFPALFKNAERHIAVIRALAGKRQGLARNEIISMAQLSEGGSVKRILEELSHSGFITAYYSFGKKKKNLLYRLTDEYALFYLQFIEGNMYRETEIWQKLSQTQNYRSWSGYAFENICLKHTQQIKRALSIGGVYSESASFYKKGTSLQKGVQIDLLIDRNDHVINIFEIKFNNTPFVLTKAHAQNLREKLAIFKAVTQTPKQLFLTLITTFGLMPNEHRVVY
ncbi:MAG: hypothetical protein KDD04_05595 [Sinomicrobium sp.]|nr:hypothetical protein [Sinomicrobium sp.]